MKKSIAFQICATLLAIVVAFLALPINTFSDEDTGSTSGNQLEPDWSSDNQNTDCQHEWNEGEITKEPTCEKAGVMTFTCKKDSTHTRIEEIAPLGHAYSDGYDSTCNRENCGHVRYAISDYNGDEEVNEQDAIYLLYTCCFGSDKYPLPEGINDEIQGKSTVPRDVIAQYRQLHKHSYKEDDKIEEIPATCSKVGTKAHFHCSVCGKDFFLVSESPIEYGYDLVIPKIDHTVVIDKATEPTCTEAGKTEGSHCSVCGEVLVAQEESDPALGHAWNDGVITKEATEAEEGVKTFTCTRDGCGQTEEKPILWESPAKED